MTKRQEASEVIKNIIRIMNEYNQVEWIKPFYEMLRIASDNSIKDEEFIVECLQIFEYINSGYGSYSDFYIKTDDKTQFKIINNELDRNNSILWSILR